MMRRCSVMRMPLEAQRASMSLDLVTVTTILRNYRIAQMASQVAAQHEGGGNLAGAIAVVALPPSDLAESRTRVEAVGRHVLLVDFEKDSVNGEARKAA